MFTRRLLQLCSAILYLRAGAELPLLSCVRGRLPAEFYAAAVC